MSDRAAPEAMIGSMEPLPSHCPECNAVVATAEWPVLPPIGAGAIGEQECGPVVLRPCGHELKEVIDG
jgi:hypothetical protein